MKRWKRLFYYLFINIAVSACTVLLILNFWEKNFHPVIETPPPLFVQPTTQNVPATEPILPQATELIEETPTPALQTYRVLQGDTLAAIAAENHTTVDELMSINYLTDPDNLAVGEILFIPIPSIITEPASGETSTLQNIPPATRTPPPTLPPGNTPTPIPSGVQISIKIVTVIGAGVLDDERVVVRYDGDGELALQNWQLEDETGQIYLFPQFSLFKGGAISVYTRSGVDTVVELFWGLDKSVWESGEVILLRDSQGSIQATARVP